MARSPADSDPPSAVSRRGFIRRAALGGGGLVGAAAGAGVTISRVMLSRPGQVLRAGAGLVALVAVAASSGAPLPARRSAVSGDLDFTFGRGGQVTTDVSPDDEAFAIVAEPDGRLVAAGRAGGSFALVAYDRDGMLDAIFGRSGRVTTSFQADAGAFALLLQPDGKLVAAGRAGGAFALARFAGDGTLDPIFGRSGRVTTAFDTDAEARALVLQPDGKLVAAGRAGGDFALARYEPDGTLDPFFGRSGRVRTAFSADAEAFAMALEPDGKLVVAGRDGGRIAIARYGADGLLDAFFGSGGEVTTAFSGDAVAFAVALDCEGSIVVAGRTVGDGGSRFALARYDRRGVLDPVFGSGGQVTTAFSGRDEARALVLQPDGKPVAAGRASPADVGGDLALARYEGSPDCADPSTSVSPSPPGGGRVLRGSTLGTPPTSPGDDGAGSICPGEAPPSTVERRVRLSKKWLARAGKTTSQRRARGFVRRAERIVARAVADGRLSPRCAAALERLMVGAAPGAVRQR
ncbi:MAG: hypothetical protein E6J79_11995 [Deltaproteobacteria bacterium]|nr:MAG: hypothetical protein E6J79_11995 [Deltaproteobacteria bacterium]